MFSEKRLSYPDISPVTPGSLVMVVLGLWLSAFCFATPARAQSSSSTDSGAQTQSQPTKSQQDQMPAEAGGPSGESGLAVPKKKDTEEAPPPPKPKGSEEHTSELQSLRHLVCR